MSDGARDHTSIHCLRQQFERDAEQETSPQPVSRAPWKKPGVVPHGQVATPLEEFGTTVSEARPSIKVAQENKLVQRYTQQFKDGTEGGGGQGSGLASGGGGSSGAVQGGSPTRQLATKRKKPPLSAQGRPPLPSKPTAEAKPRIVVSKLKSEQDREPSSGGTCSKDGLDGDTSARSVSETARCFESNTRKEVTYESITGDLESEQSSRGKSSQNLDAQPITKSPYSQQVGVDPNEFYSKVDMTRKKKYRESQPSAATGNQPTDNDMDGGDYALLRVSVSSARGSDGEPSPVSPKSPGPTKPPRTFAHDEYLAHKQHDKEIRRQQKKMAREVEHRSRLQNVTEYEEIGNANTKPVIPMEPTSSSPAPRQVATPAAKLDLRRPCDRPPPPPRPPPINPRKTVAGPISGDPHRREKAFIQVLSHNDKQPKTAFLSKGKVSNPSYEADWDIIRIRSPQNSDESSSMKRSKSDECLYAEPGVHNGAPAEPLYSEPVDRVGVVPGSALDSSQRRLVQVDAEGYAVPETGPHLLYRQNTVIDGQSRRKCDTLASGKAHYVKRKPVNCGPGIRLRPASKKRPQVQEKLSRAYSVLRMSGQGRDDMAMEHGCTEEQDDSDNEIDADEHHKRLIYVSAVKQRLSLAIQQSSRKIPQDLTHNLFHYAALIGLEATDDIHRHRTKTLFNFPKQDQTTLDVIAQFCFPDLQVWRPVSRYKSETFSFVLTDELARRKYGYCKRFLPPGNGNRLPVVCCVVSALDAFTFYRKLLADTKEKWKISQEYAEMLLQAAYACRIPEPGQEAWISTMTAGDKKETLFIKRPTDTREENVSFEPLLSNLSVENLIKVFASVLLERKLIFVAQHLSTLTSCIHALWALLYPLSWPHPFIPVLPEGMLGVCETPTPILVGVLTSAQPKLAEIPMDEILMVDLDHNTLMRSQGDEGRIIPKKLQKALKMALKEDGDTATSHDLLVQESFLRFFVETMGHYTEYICTQMDGEKIFEKKAFITSVSSKSIRMFLEWFTETQMFEMFITDRMENIDSAGLFETRIHEYRQEMSESPNIKQNMKVVGRKMIDFFIASGDKLKKTFSRNVFI